MLVAVRAGGKWERFHRDMLQLFTNAKLYNVEGSSVYNDAVELEAVFRAQPSPKRVSSYGNDYLPMVDVTCAACNGAHRAHTCDPAFRISRTAKKRAEVSTTSNRRRNFFVASPDFLTRSCFLSVHRKTLPSGRRWDSPSHRPTLTPPRSAWSSGHAAPADAAPASA